MSLIRFIPVTEITDPLNIAIGLSGGSGTGKTYTALLLARGIAEVVAGRRGAPIGYVDTENRRALHYKSKFPEMHHYDMQALDGDGNMIGFSPERWIEVIDHAEAADMPVVIIDSLSHSWEGVNGVLDLQAQEIDRLTAEAAARSGGLYAVDASKFSEQAWIRPKARYRRLIDRIVRAKTNVIICNRAKPVRQSGYGDKAKNARTTKLRRDDVPWDISGDANLIFEMSASIILDPSKPGFPVHQIKVADQFKAIFDAMLPMGVETGRAMAEWARGQGEAQAQKAMMDEAREACRNGTDALRGWYRENTEKRQMADIIMPELRALASEADKRVSRAGEDPFGLPPLDADPADQIDAETRAQMLREAEEQFARERAAEEAAAG